MSKKRGVKPYTGIMSLHALPAVGMVESITYMFDVQSLRMPSAILTKNADGTAHFSMHFAPPSLH